MKYIFSVLLLVVTISCSTKQDIVTDDNVKKISFRFNKNIRNDEPLKMSQLYDSVRYVMLDDVGQTVLIGEVTELCLDDEYMYIFDRKSDAVFKYDYNGQFIKKYHHKGRGPGEYVTLATFDVDRRNGNIVFYDLAQRKIIVYSKDNNFLYEYRIKNDLPRDFAVLNNGDHVFLTYDYMKGVRRGIWQCDSMGVMKRPLVEIDESFKFSSGLFPTYFRHLGNTVYVRGSEDGNYLYHIYPDSITTPYQFDIDIKIPDRIRTSPLPEMSDKNRGKVYAVTGYLETKKWIVVSATNLKERHAIFYNKVNNSQHYVSSPDDVIDDMPPTGVIMATTKDTFVGVLSVGYILSYQKTREMFPLINEDSNPVISISKVL